MLYIKFKQLPPSQCYKCLTDKIDKHINTQICKHDESQRFLQGV